MRIDGIDETEVVALTATLLACMDVWGILSFLVAESLTVFKCLWVGEERAPKPHEHSGDVESCFQSSRDRPTSGACVMSNWVILELYRSLAANALCFNLSNEVNSDVDQCIHGRQWMRQSIFIWMGIFCYKHVSICLPLLMPALCARYLSYPRTESTAYPASFDISATLTQQV